MANVTCSGFTVVVDQAGWLRVDTIDDLRDISSDDTNLGAWVLGGTTSGDGGGGLYYWSASSVAADNGITVIAPNDGGGGRWNKFI
jgi:hypothetical protein